MQNSPTLYSTQDLEGLRASASALKEVLIAASGYIKPGITTLQLNNKVADLISCIPRAEPLFKGYDGYPFESCISVNSLIVHGHPSAETVIREGDLVSLDVGIRLDGYCSDAARTVTVGYNPVGSEMVGLAERCYQAALKVCNPGRTTGDIGYAIQTEIAKVKFPNFCNKYKVFPNFQGHGIGRALHEPPGVPNFGFPGTGVTLQAGMCLCIEPILICKSANVEQATSGHPNSVTVFKTSDGTPAVHYENQVYIAHSGPIELTR